MNYYKDKQSGKLFTEQEMLDAVDAGDQLDSFLAVSILKNMNIGNISSVNAAHTVGTSFHGTTILATPSELIAALGEPTYLTNDGQDKVNMEWCLQIDGKPFTIYDWKEYMPLNMHSGYDWHIGGPSKAVAEEALAALIQMLGR